MKMVYATILIAYVQKEADSKNVDLRLKEKAELYEKMQAGEVCIVLFSLLIQCYLTCLIFIFT